jgi:hypothetical protein
VPATGFIVGETLLLLHSFCFRLGGDLANPTSLLEMLAIGDLAANSGISGTSFWIQLGTDKFTFLMLRRELDEMNICRGRVHRCSEMEHGTTDVG